PNRSTIDQIFTLRQILEKKREHDSEVHNLCVDFKKAYDSIHREGLFNIMAEFGFSRKLIRMTAVCLCGVRSRVVSKGVLSDAFDVNTGLRQG
ncbi:reverse transcriptase domain-containing protein, partial [Acinetobacter baumannii]